MHDDDRPTEGSDAESQPAAWLSGDDLTASLLTAVGEETGTPVPDLPPLHDAVDPEALTAMLTGSSGDGVSMAFNYAGVRVRIDGDGYLFVQSRPE